MRLCAAKTEQSMRSLYHVTLRGAKGLDCMGNCAAIFVFDLPPAVQILHSVPLPRDFVQNDNEVTLFVRIKIPFLVLPCAERRGWIAREIVPQFSFLICPLLSRFFTPSRYRGTPFRMTMTLF